MFKTKQVLLRLYILLEDVTLHFSISLVWLHISVWTDALYCSETK